MLHPLNVRIAGRLEETADLLEEQRANPFRARAYRRAAETVRSHPRSMRELAEARGMEGLRELPGVGESLARSIFALAVTGRLPMLDRLRGEADPVALLRTVPGIGRITAERIHHDLDIDTLEELEVAAHDGRLADILGIGKKRLGGIVDSLQARLGAVRGGERAPADAEPPVSELLDVDREYRDRAAAGELRRIAPRRFNPGHEAWLPVLHTQRGERHYTALFSNTARAHQLGATRDWVVLHCDGGCGERQYTVITSHWGPTAGRRIVRGRQDEGSPASR
ncbi:MAG: DNA-binding protein [Acidobacteria bacterium]|nr:DNA-binding protein [Acidobacteriota bacterium]